MKGLRFHVGWLLVVGIGLLFAGVIALITTIEVNNGYNDDPATHWVLVGGTTSSTASFRVRDDGITPVRLLIATTADFEKNKTVSINNIFPTDQKVQAIEVTNLTATTQYYYQLISLDSTVFQEGQFRTPAQEGTAFDFKVATAGCAWTGSNNPVFEEIADEDADFFLHLGDLHYEDINSNDMDKRLNAIDKVIGSSEQRKALAGGLVYIWDDHDWLGNDSGEDSETETGGRETALKSYQLAFPHYPLALTGPAVPVYHAFTYGTVRFIISDLRSEATNTTIYSSAQRQWLENELSQSSQYDLVVWATTRPWIADSDEGNDMWAGYAANRSELSTFISDTVTSGNLIAIASDAHMVALDSGTNTYYGSASNAKSFPILQTGPLDRLGSNKGGPYTGGCHTTKYARNHQYAVMSFTFGSGGPCVEIKTYRVASTSGKEDILSQTFCGNFFQESSLQVRSGSCDSDLFETPVIIFVSLALALLLILTGVMCYFMHIWEASLLTILAALWVVAMVALGIGIPYVQGIEQFDLFNPTLIVLAYVFSLCLALGILMFVRERKWRREGRAEINKRREAERQQQERSQQYDTNKYFSSKRDVKQEEEVVDEPYEQPSRDSRRDDDDDDDFEEENSFGEDEEDEEDFEEEDIRHREPPRHYNRQPQYN